MSNNNLLEGGGFPDFIGVVEDRIDPEMKRRVRVRCFGIHSADKTQIPTSSLPWARVLLPTTMPRTSTMDLWEGTLVYGVFLDGNEYQQPLVIGIVESNEGGGNPNNGFTDPRSYAIVGKPDADGSTNNEPYTSGSPRNGISSYADSSLYENTVASFKKDNLSDDESIIMTRTTDEEGEEQEPYREPENPANALYPYNHVHESESGHVIEIDDTPGSERVHIFHRSGTFLELHPGGDIVCKAEGSNHSIVLSNRHDITLGDVEALTEGDHDERISGNFKIEIYGDSDVYIAGDAKIQIDGDLTSKVDGDADVTIGGDAKLDIGGDFDTEVGGDYSIDVGGMYKVKATTINLN